MFKSRLLHLTCESPQGNVKFKQKCEEKKLVSQTKNRTLKKKKELGCETVLNLNIKQIEISKEN